MEGVGHLDGRRGVRRAHGRWEVGGFGDSTGSFRRPVATSPGRHRSPAVRTPRRHGRSAVLVAVGLAALVLAAPEEAEAQTATTLVSNFGRTSSGTVELFNEQAGLGIFETGVSSATLTSIELQARGFNPVPSVTLYTGTVNTSTQEVTLDTEVATFTALRRRTCWTGSSASPGCPCSMLRENGCCRTKWTCFRTTPGPRREPNYRYRTPRPRRRE